MPLRKDIEKSQRLGTMRQLNPEKLANLPAFNQQLDEEYGKPGPPEREEFHKEALLVLRSAAPQPPTGT